MHRNLLLIASIVLSLPAAVLAATFDVSVTQPESTLTGDTAFALLTVNNTIDESTFLGSQPLAASPANTWATIENPNIRIGPSESSTMRVRLNVAKDAKPGTYQYSMTVNKLARNEKVEKTFALTVRQRDRWAVTKNLKLSCVQCEDSLSLFTDVANVGKNRIDDVKIVLNAPKKTQELFVGSLEVGESKSLTAFIDISELDPKSYTITAETVSGSQSMDREQIGFAIPSEKTVDVKRKETITPWSKSVELVATNVGNALTEYNVKSQVTNTFWATITYSQPPLTKGDVYAWLVKLNPGESTTITYTEFYWPIIILIALIIIGILYVYFFFTSISISKKAVKHGGEISVSLLVKNKGVPVDGVTIRDVIPEDFVLSGTFETLKPIVRKIGSGTEAIWRLGTIRRGEEILLHYKIKPRGIVTGEHSLPSAHLTARKGANTITTISNHANIDMGPGPSRIRVKTE